MKFLITQWERKAGPYGLETTKVVFRELREVSVALGRFGPVVMSEQLSELVVYPPKEMADKYYEYFRRRLVFQVTIEALDPL